MAYGEEEGSPDANLGLNPDFAVVSVYDPAACS